MFLQLVGLAVAAAAVVAVIKQPAAGVAVLMVGYMASSVARPTPTEFTAHMGPLALHPIDLAVLVVLVAYLVRRTVGIDREPIPRAILLLAAVVAVALLRGFHSYGAQVAINADRQWIWFAAALVYATSVPWDRRLVKVLVLAFGVVEAFACWGLATHGLRNANEGVVVNGEFVTLRPLTASSAMLLLQLAILLAAVEWPWPRLKLPLIAAAGVLMLLSQQRTVAIAAILVAPILFLKWLQRTHRRDPETGYAIFGTAMLALPVVVWLIATSSVVQSSVASTSTTNSTLGWRLDSWRSLIDLIHGSDWLTGTAAGHSMNRYISGNVFTDVQAHNVYVDALFRFGLLGVVALALVWFSAYRAARDADVLPWPRWAAYAVIAAQLVFGIAYSLNMSDGLCLGLIAAAALADQRARAAAPVAPRAELAVPHLSR